MRLGKLPSNVSEKESKYRTRQIQAEAGLDAIMTNKVRLISETLSKRGL